MAIKNAVLMKKIGNTVYDLYVRTQSSQVVHGANGETTVEDALDLLNGDASTSGSVANSIAQKLGTMTVGSDTYTTVAAYGAAILAAAEDDADDKIGSLEYDSQSYSTFRAVADAIFADIQGDLTKAFIFKGSVDYVDLLPAAATSNNGNVYVVRYRGTSTEAGSEVLNAEYASNGSEWVELGTDLDMSDYSTTTQMNAAIDQAIADAMGITGTSRGSATTLTQIAAALNFDQTQYATVVAYVQAVKNAALGTMQVGSTTYDNVGAYVNAALGSMTVAGTSANNVGTYMQNVLTAADTYADDEIGSLTYTPAGGSSTTYNDMRSVLNAMFADANSSLGVFIAGTGDPTAANLTENDLYIKYSAS